MVKTLRARRGFTLLEAAVTIAVLGTVAVLSFLALTASQKQFDTSVGKGYQEQVIAAELNYAQANGTFTAIPTNLTGVPRSVAVVTGPVASTNQVSIAVDASTGALGLATTNGSGTCTVQLVATPTNGATRTAVSLPTNGSCQGASAITNPSVQSSAPYSVAATAGNGQATVTWLAPTTLGNSSISGYTVLSSPGNYTCQTTSALSCTVGGLTNGNSYTFTVVANTTVGPSPASSPSNAVTPATTPSAPTAVVASAGDGSASVSWVAPASNGGATITSYTVTSTPDGQTCTATGTLTCTVSGLTNGTKYTFTVYATNVMGPGTLSASSNAVIPAGAPSPPTGVTVVVGVRSATVTWTPPYDNGGSSIVSYTVTSSPGGATCTYTVSSPETDSCLVTGLLNATTYTFTVTATNTAGTSKASDPSAAVTTPGVPSPPTNVVATPTYTSGSGAALAITWGASAANGTPVLFYTATASNGSNCTYTVSSPETDTCTITGLTNGNPYTVTVTATNAAGTSLAFSGTLGYTQNVAIPFGVPSAPTWYTSPGPPGVAGNGQVTLYWNAAASNGSTITGYTVAVSSSPTAVPPASCVNTLNLYCVFTGLTPGTNYTFTVTAINNNGQGIGPASANSASYMPYTYAAAPTGLGVSAAVNAITVTWTNVATSTTAASGYTAITNYVATAYKSGVATSASCTVGNQGSCTIYQSGSDPTRPNTYTVVLCAVNAAGTSPNCSTSAAVEPNSVPLASPVISSGTIVSASQLQLTWNFTGDNGGLSITGYTIYAYTYSGSYNYTGNSCAITTSNTSGVTCTISGLSSGINYYFAGSATNNAGTGQTYSTYYGPLTTLSTPGQPTITYAVDSGLNVTLNWTDGATNGASITNWEYLYSTDAISWARNTMGASPQTVGPFAACTPYYIEVADYNSQGWGLPSNPIYITTDCAPSMSSITPSVSYSPPDTFTVSWTTATESGPDSIGYHVYDTVGAPGCTTSTYSCTFSDPMQISWGSSIAFYVAPYNLAGTGSASHNTSAVSTYFSVNTTVVGGGGAPGASQATPGTAGGGGANVSCTYNFPLGNFLSYTAGSNGINNSSGWAGGTSSTSGFSGGQSCNAAGGAYGGGANSGASGNGKAAGANNGSGSSEHFGGSGGCGGAGTAASSSVGGNAGAQCSASPSGYGTIYVGGGGPGCKSGNSQCGTDPNVSNFAGGGSYASNASGGQAGVIFVEIATGQGLGSSITSGSIFQNGWYIWVCGQGTTSTTGSIYF